MSTFSRTPISCVCAGLRKLAPAVVDLPPFLEDLLQDGIVAADGFNGGPSLPCRNVRPIPAPFSGPAAVIDHAVGDERIVARHLPH